MSQATQTEKPKRAVHLSFDRDLTEADMEQIRQKTDALMARFAPPQAAHHHDVTALA